MAMRANVFSGAAAKNEIGQEDPLELALVKSKDPMEREVISGILEIERRLKAIESSLDGTHAIADAALGLSR